eukprot:g15768.t1
MDFASAWDHFATASAPSATSSTSQSSTSTGRAQHYFHPDGRNPTTGTAQSPEYDRRRMCLEDLSCAMIAVFGFKFKKHDLKLSAARHAKLVSGRRLSAVEDPLNTVTDAEQQSDSFLLTRAEFFYARERLNRHSPSLRKPRHRWPGHIFSLAGERRTLLESVSDPLYKQFTALDVRSAGQVDASDLVNGMSHRPKMGAEMAARIVRAVAEPGREYFTYQDYVRHMEAAAEKSTLGRCLRIAVMAEGLGNLLQAAPATGAGQIEVLFDISKKELGSPQTNYKKLVRKLRSEFKVGVNKDLITLDRLKECGLVIFAGPREMFTTDEFDAVKRYLSPECKGSVLFLLGEGGETRFNTNVNYLLEEFGIMVNNAKARGGETAHFPLQNIKAVARMQAENGFLFKADSVIRTTFCKYHHPKECFIGNGVLSKDLLKHAGRPGGADGVGGRGAGAESTRDDGMQHGAKSALEFVYPFGATMNVQKPAVPVLSTGPISYPLNRPICAVHEGSGRLAVLGSVNMFGDDFLDKDHNGKLADLLIKWLTRRNDCDLSFKYGEEPEIPEYHFLPHTQLLAESLKSCLSRLNPVEIKSPAALVADPPGAAAPAGAAAQQGAGESQEQQRVVGPDIYGSKEKYQLLRSLQAALFGGVYEAKGCSSRQRYAVKVLHKSELQKTPPSLDFCEVPLSELRFEEEMKGHPHIVEVHEAFEDEYCHYIVFELAARGDLLEALKLKPDGFRERECRFLIREAVLGLQKLHERKLAMQDVSLENLLIFDYDGKIRIKICDPGQAVLFSENEAGEEQTVPYKGLVGKSFRPPELSEKKPYLATKVDSWCLGWSTFYLLCALPLFLSADHQQRDPDYWTYFRRGEFEGLFRRKNGIDQKVSPECLDFILSLMKINPAERLSVRDCLEHPWLRDENIDVTQLISQDPRTGATQYHQQPSSLAWLYQPPRVGGPHAHPHAQARSVSTGPKGSGGRAAPGAGGGATASGQRPSVAPPPAPPNCEIEVRVALPALYSTTSGHPHLVQEPELISMIIWSDDKASRIVSAWVEDLAAREQFAALRVVSASQFTVSESELPQQQGGFLLAGGAASASSTSSSSRPAPGPVVLRRDAGVRREPQFQYHVEIVSDHEARTLDEKVVIRGDEFSDRASVPLVAHGHDGGVEEKQEGGPRNPATSIQKCWRKDYNYVRRWKNAATEQFFRCGRRRGKPRRTIFAGQRVRTIPIAVTAAVYDDAHTGAETA